MQYRKILLVALFASASFSIAVSAFGDTFCPIDFTGFNRDVIYGPDGGTGGGYALGADVKNEWAPYAVGTIDVGGAAHSDGLPCGGTFTSLSNSSHTYALAAAGGDTESKNALWLTSTTNPTGSLTLTTPGRYSGIGVLAAAPDNGASGTIRLNYSDATYAETAFSLADWFQTSQPANAACKGGLSCYGFGNVDNCHIVNYGSYLYLTEQVFSADSTKTLTSVTFTQTGGPGNVNIFGLSGAAVQTPEPATLLLTAIGLFGIAAYACRKRR